MKLAPVVLLERLEYLTQIGIALSREHDFTKLLDTILLAAKNVTGADGGTLYRVVDRKFLKFEIVRNDTLRLAMGGSTATAIPFAPLPLYREDGNPNHAMIAAHAVLNNTTVNVADAYAEEGFDFSGTRAFDESTGYRSTSFLTVPMRDHEGDIIGVLQLINARDSVTGATVRFSVADERLVEAIASQAAIALTNRNLIAQLESLFESFIQLINVAIDEKSPYTGRHCARVPALTMMLAEAAERVSSGPLAGFRMSTRDRYELRIASLLHDCGKVTTPVHVVDKATKLQTIFDRIQLIDTRFEVIKRDIRQRALESRLESLARSDPDEPAANEEATRQAIVELEADRDFLHWCNVGTESMAAEDQTRVREISEKYTWVGLEGRRIPFLTDDEIENLTIRSGTLTAGEREIINYHIVASIRMLEALPWPKHLESVAEYAGGHHERMDGCGYPRGLRKSEMSVQARIMAIADIFEALTAGDRPYKRGKSLRESLNILGKLSENGHIDRDLFRVFITEKVYLGYARAYLDPEQIEEIDESTIPGFHD